MILFAVSLLTTIPMIFIGVFEGPDTSQHIQFASTYHQALLSGDFYPSWGAAENLGYGSVGARIYPPMFSFLIAAIYLLTNDWHTALWTLNFVFTFVGGVGVYLLAREFMARKGALVAGVILILMPFHLSEIHINSFYSEYAGVGILAFVFLFVARVCKRGDLASALGLAVSYSLLILTHIPAAVIGSLALLIFSLIMITKEKFFSTFLKLALSVVAALAATSFYWLRFINEMDWYRGTKFVTDSTFDYDEHFLLTIPSDTVFGIWYNNQILIAIILLVTCALIGRKFSVRFAEKQSITGIVVVFFIAVFMMTPLSTPIWIYLPYLKEVQFPWRWQIITCVTGSVIIASGFRQFVELVKSSFSLKRPIIWLSAFSLFFAASSFFKIVSKYRKDYIPVAEFSTWAQEKKESMGFDYFWTTKTKAQAFLVKEKVIAGERNVEILRWDPTERIFRVENGESVKARVATLYYPHWRVEIDNVSGTLEIADDGVIQVSLPSENATVRIWFEEPWFIYYAIYLSGAIWIFFLLASFGLILFKKRRDIDSESST